MKVLELPVIYINYLRIDLLQGNIMAGRNPPAIGSPVRDLFKIICCRNLHKNAPQKLNFIFLCQEHSRHWRASVTSARCFFRNKDVVLNGYPEDPKQSTEPCPTESTIFISLNPPNQIQGKIWFLTLKEGRRSTCQSGILEFSLPPVALSVCSAGWLQLQQVSTTEKLSQIMCICSACVERGKGNPLFIYEMLPGSYVIW